MKNQIRDFIAINKWRMSLGYQWGGMLGIGFLVAKTLRDVLSEININIPLTYLFFAGVIGLWVGGLIVEKLGLYSAESSYATIKNDYMRKHLEKK